MLSVDSTGGPICLNEASFTGSIRKTTRSVSLTGKKGILVRAERMFNPAERNFRDTCNCAVVCSVGSGASPGLLDAFEASFARGVPKKTAIRSPGIRKGALCLSRCTKNMEAISVASPSGPRRVNICVPDGSGV